MQKKQVAIVVPMHNRAELTPDEQTSFEHLQYYLGGYDKFLVVPDSLNINLPGCSLKRFGDEYFGSVAANTRLLLSEDFYRSFTDYEYILIYHLDALVFSDQLRAWCDTGLDYIGPPWLQCADSPWVKEARVGNGGFSLRKIESFLKVFRSDVYWMEPGEYWQEKYAGRALPVRMLNSPRRWLKRLSRFNNARLEMARWHLRPDGTKNEDHFGLIAPSITCRTSKWPRLRMAYGLRSKWLLGCVSNSLEGRCRLGAMLGRDMIAPSGSRI